MWPVAGVVRRDAAELVEPEGRHLGLCSAARLLEGGEDRHRREITDDHEALSGADPQRRLHQNNGGLRELVTADVGHGGSPDLTAGAR